jgi:hypothetical protein
MQLIKNYRDLVLRERRDTPSGALEGKSVEELAPMFANFGGISPPRPLDGVHDPEREYADRVATLESWKNAIDGVNAGPLPSKPKGGAK